MTLEKSFEPASPALITPEKVYGKPQADIPTLIVTFSYKIIDALKEDGLLEEPPAAYASSVNGDKPVYRVKGHPGVGIYMTIPGAAGTVTFMEEFGYLTRAKRFIFFGSAGALDPELTAGKIIVPSEAYRDEGTSFHYAPASAYLTIPKADEVAAAFAQLGIPFVKGRTWTTDAIYRETAAEADRRRRDGCICVEMEVASAQAFCSYRGYDFYPFVYSADSLGADSWDRRILGHLALDRRLEHYAAALAIAERFE